jgi:hypothetical protein
MRIQTQLRIIANDNSVISKGKILQLDKGDDRLEVIGLSFDDGKDPMRNKCSKLTP